MTSRCRFVVLRDGKESKNAFSQAGWKRALAKAEKSDGTIMVECEAAGKTEGQASMDFARKIEWIRLALCEGGRCHFVTEDQPHKARLAGGRLGAYSSAHLEKARAFIDQARQASRRSTPGCGSALPHIVQAREALAASWEHLNAISPAIPRVAKKSAKYEVRVAEINERNRLMDERKQIEKKVQNDLSEYINRCVRMRWG